MKVYTASRYSQAASEAPASVTVVTREQIQKSGYRTLGDVLRSVRSFYISYDRQYSYIGVRGFSNPGDYNTRVLLMVDGHRLNDTIYEQAMVGTEFSIDINLIERVEVIRGPASSLYGTNAVFAVINVITRKASDIHGFEGEGDASSFNSYRGRLTYGGKFHGLDMVLSGTFFGSKGHNQLFYPEFNSPDTSNGIASHADDDQFVDLLATLSTHGLKFQSVYNTREKGDPTGSWGGAFNDRRNRETDAHGYVDLRYEHGFGASGTVMARTYFDRYVFHGTYVAPGASGGVLNKDFDVGENWGGEVQASTSIHDLHKLIGGIEYRKDFRQQLSNFDVSPPATYLNVNAPAYVVAPYVEGSFVLGKGLSFTPGLRLDYNPRVGWTTSPRVALNYHFLKGSVLKAMYGQAFRSPNAYELYYYPPPTGVSLKAERITAWEGNWDQALTHNLSLSLSVFSNQMRNFIGLDTTTYSNLSYYNLGKLKSDGTELELDGQWMNGISAQSSYSYELQQKGADEQRLIGSPKHLGKFNLSVPLMTRKVFATVDAQYVGRRITLRQEQVSPYTVVNVTVIARKLISKLDFSASVHNALNKRFYDPGSQQHLQDDIQQDRRSLGVKLVWRFGED